MHKLLETIGLSPFQSIIYAFICEHGLSSASRISRQTGIQRSMCYVVLSELTDIKMLYRDDSRKVARFGLTNPELLSSLVEARVREAKQAETAYHTVIEQVKQQFAIQNGQPGVRFYSGTDGLRALYQNINASGTKEILLIRSRILTEPTMFDVIIKQVEAQVTLGIHVKVINSSHDPDLEMYRTKDGERLTERKILPGEVYQNPSQIIIYGNRVGFTTYRNPMITVVIEHEDIATTMRSMYAYVWKKADTDTAYYLNTLKK